MTQARISRPVKNVMQSGRANVGTWVLEFEPEAAKRPDPLMGWANSSDTRGQVRLRFASRDEAVAFAQSNGLSYRILEPKERRIRPKSYSGNFIPKSLG